MRDIQPVFLIMLLIFLNACERIKSAFEDQKNYIPLKSGGSYELIKDGTGDCVHLGNVLKLQMVQEYKDSILHDSKTAGFEYLTYDLKTLDPESIKVFSGTRKGDSLVFHIDADSAFKGKKVKFKVQGGEMITKIKILDILENADSAKADFNRTRSTKD